MAFIRKEGKYYKVYFQIGNKKYKRSTRTTSRKIAEDIRKKIENEIATGIFKIENYSPRDQKLLKEFLAEATRFAKTNKSTRTVEREIVVYKNFLGYCKNIPLSAVTVKLIEAYKVYLQDEREFSPNSINIELRHLSAAFSLAVKYNYLPKNPFRQVRKVKTPKKKPLFLTFEQAEKLLAHTANRSVYQYILIALNTGARISEVCHLKWKNVDLNHRLITIEGKGSKERVVPIPQQLLEFLKERENSQEYVVTGSRSRTEITHQFRVYADEIGLNEYTFHNLRHTYASWLVQNGVNLKIIQELLGHESIQTTLIYAHLAPDNKYQAVKVLNTLFGFNDKNKG